jgi:catechol 2,3-dioxygenase-like lactoylglutathione lyase family enzyme
VLRLRQVALAARDLDAAVAALREALGLEVGFRDPGVAFFGLRNAVLPVGGDFLEVVSPLRDEAPAARFLARRGGRDGGYMAIFQVDDLAAARERLARLGTRIVFEHALEVPETSARTATLHLHPRDLGAAIVSLDESTPAEGWAWAGPDWERHVRRAVVTAIAGLELCGPDPTALSARWAAVLDRSAKAGAKGEREIALDDGAIRFARGSDEAITGVDLRAADPARAGTSFEIAGTRIRIVA